MDDLVVGEGSLELRDVVKEIERSKSFVRLTRKWKHFGKFLRVNDIKLMDLERRLKMGDLPLELIACEIIGIWKAANGRNATLTVLHKALIECGAQNAAESLITKYLKPDSIRCIKVLWKCQLITLEELLGENTSQDTYQRIFDEFKKTPFQQARNLLKELNPPTQPNYYIQRTLFHMPSKELDGNKLFISPLATKNVFVIKGVSMQALAKLCGYGAIDRSCNQLNYVNANFIELISDGDFYRICEKSVKPVHLIQHNDGHYFLVTSNKNTDYIRDFLKDPGIYITEQELVSKLSSDSSPRTLSIADSPGMGKTLALANLAKNIQRKQSRSIVLFVVLQEIAQRLRNVNSRKSALEAIATHSTCDPTSAAVLMEMLSKDGHYQLNLFLDGYDEVMEHKLKEVDSFLMHVQELKNVKIIVTTRAHLQSRLEIIFNEFSYEILPFNDLAQINFLISYWIDHGAQECSNLRYFAQACLAALELTLTDKEKVIAGIPLQCRMLAEVYVEDAKQACSSPEIFSNRVEPITLFEMYKKLVDHKLNKIGDSNSRQNYLNAHVYLAIIIIFPTWIESFKPFLIGYEETDSNTMYSIGLVEKSHDDNTPRFIHRTYAEYLLAEFIVKTIEIYAPCVDLLFGEIFGANGVSHNRKELVEYSKAQWLTSYIFRFEDDIYGFKFPTLSYFIELHFRECSRSRSVNVSLPIRLLRKTWWPGKFNSKDLCITVKACCSNDLESTFDYATNILHEYGIGFFLKDNYFKNLPHNVIQTSNNVTMLEKVLTFTLTEFRVDLGYHTLMFWKSSEWSEGYISNCSPLHIAVLMGKYNMVTLLARQFGEKIHTLKYLLHICVHRSAGENESKIEEKLLIIDKLVGINPAWLNEVDDVNCTPLLQYDVHLSLLRRLVEHGADINAYSNIRGTVLHRLSNIQEVNRLTDLGLLFVFPDLDLLRQAYWAYQGNWTTAISTPSHIVGRTGFNTYRRNYGNLDQESYAELFRWAISNGFNLINHRNNWKQTPLLVAIEAFGRIEEEVLRQFYAKGADFNSCDENGDSVLFHALGQANSIDFIGNLLECGADLSHLNNEQQNAVHFIMKSFKDKWGSDAQQALNVIKFLDFKGFNGFNERDSKGRTPLDLARELGMHDEDLTFLQTLASRHL